MSLINEALKKAQRQRTEAASGGDTPTDGSPGIAKRAAPKSAKSMVLMAVGVLVIVVLAIALTAWWITRPIGQPGTEVARAKPAPAAPVAEAPAPLVVPAISVPKSAEVAPRVIAAKPEPKRPVASTAPTEANSGSAATPVVTEAPATAPEVASAAPEVKPAPAAPQPDARIRQFVDSIRVAGIRSSGADSKVLMNDRVYRLNQLVNPELGIRLTKVSSDSLTFTDRNGVEYVKYL